MATTKKTKTALDNELREKKVAELMELLSETANEEVLQVGGNVIAFPTTDEEGNEAWIEVTVKVPKGARLGKGEGFEGYDGYSMAEFFKAETERKRAEALAKKANADAKKANQSKSKRKAVEPTEPVNSETEDMPDDITEDSEETSEE